ncbi:hypothetical protein C900_02090 [Fulvivirga imtechensis AK7]|uniref:Uncharacterized protein n=1 Tax=Fulvivirga imtechensis AK7 TaxID=1237149 RepID=L8JX89_9BACT|nr:hypothetical protein [Fulvivirga imtechensis]ELR73686.1 hypothetical protein C900_02090 [Fulvivirga imtechensis AK7]
MKLGFFLFLNLFGLPLLAQTETTFKINEGFSSNSKTGASHALMVNLNGDIEQLISHLQKDFAKKGSYTVNDGTNRDLFFYNILIPGLGEEKATFNLRSISNGNKHIITITCRGKKKKDFLKKGSDSQPVVREYLEGVLRMI